MHGGAVEIEVGDEGQGFDPTGVPDERLGLRRSIVERTAKAGGHAEVRTALGRGTVVVLSWPVFVDGAGVDDDEGLLDELANDRGTGPASTGEGVTA